MNEDYRVNLEIYNGPLDLLLYLIRREEVDIYDIPIARITEQYLEYVQLLRQLDPNVAGDFLVLAATLMEIKTRMLLPGPAPDDEGAEGVELDPRAELVRQLLEYKAFKDAAGDLRGAAEQHTLRFERRPAAPELDPSEIDLEDVQVWDLMDALNRLMAAIGQQARDHEVIYDDTPVEAHAEDIVDRLGSEGPLTFERIFEGTDNRSEIVGLFLALLELVRQRKVLIRQDRNFGEIRIELNPNPPTEEELRQQEEALERAQAAARRQTSETAGPGSDTEPKAEHPDEDMEPGRYVADSPEPAVQEPESEDPTEDRATGT